PTVAASATSRSADTAAREPIHVGSNRVRSPEPGWWIRSQYPAGARIPANATTTVPATWLIRIGPEANSITKPIAARRAAADQNTASDVCDSMYRTWRRPSGTARSFDGLWFGRARYVIEISSIRSPTRF